MLESAAGHTEGEGDLSGAHLAWHPVRSVLWLPGFAGLNTSTTTLNQGTGFGTYFFVLQHQSHASERKVNNQFLPSDGTQRLSPLSYTEWPLSL